jgi:myo-inositol catabolism protein IolS
MQQRRLGSSQVSVSEIGLGTWGMSGAFWGAANDSESIRVIHQALDLGVTLIDTAEAYGRGHAEEVVGKALAGRREKAVIATKAAPNHLEPAEAVKALEGSLKRLQTDYVDVYFIHWPNPDVPLGATMDAFERLRAEGRIRALGVSNFGAKEMDAARQHGIIDVLQPPYNMLWREVEAATLPYCREHNIGVMPYSGLAQGLLTGALHRVRRGRRAPHDGPFPAGDLRARARCGRGPAPDRGKIRQVRRAARGPVAHQPARRQRAALGRPHRP